VRGSVATSLIAGLVGFISATAACSRAAQVAGRADTEGARRGVRCEVALKDPGYKDGRSLGSLAVRTGEDFHGTLQDPGRSPLAPASPQQYLTVKDVRNARAGRHQGHAPSQVPSQQQ